MEIRNEARINIQWYAEAAARGKRMPEKDGKHEQGDVVDIKSGLARGKEGAPEVRKDKVERARENILSGKYKDSKVMDEIVNRIIEQFGL